MSDELSFAFQQATRVVYAAGAVRDAGLEAKRLGIERAVIVTDKVLREKTDAVARLEAALGARCVLVFDESESDAPAPVVDRAAKLARDKSVDGVVSLGGGSAIDTAKGVAILLTLGGDTIRQHQGSGMLGRRLVPHLAVPTTAGTGSEVSQYAVIADPEARVPFLARGASGDTGGTGEKMHFADDRLVPDTAILDPELTLGMPAKLTAATGMDALTHAVEAYQSINRNPLTDALALHAIRLVAKWLPVAVEKPGDVVARGRMLLASNLAGQAMSSAGVGLVHAVAHVVGARHHVHHGTANAILLAPVMRFNSDELGERLADIAQAAGVGDAIAWVAKLVGQLGLPTRLRDVGVPEADLPALAEAALSDGAIVYNGKFAADAELVLPVVRAAW